MRKILTSAVLTIGLAASTVVLAQQTPQSGPRAEGQERHGKHKRMGRRGGRMGRGRHGGMRALHKLNLTDAQREQFRALHENHRASTEPQREELRGIMQARRQGGQLTPEQEARARQLRESLMQSQQAVHAQTLNLLTPEQRAQLEQMKQEGKARREGARMHRGMRALSRLNLTDAQQQQIRSLHESFQQSTEAQREELRGIMQARRQGGQLTPEQEARARQLHEGLREAQKNLHAQTLNLLTPEQRAQLEQMKQKREEFRQRHKERRQMRRQNDQQQF